MSGSRFLGHANPKNGKVMLIRRIITAEPAVGKKHRFNIGEIGNRGGLGCPFLLPFLVVT